MAAQEKGSRVLPLGAKMGSLCLVLSWRHSLGAWFSWFVPGVMAPAGSHGAKSEQERRAEEGSGGVGGSCPSADKAACHVGFGQPGPSQAAALGKERPGLRSDTV